MAFVVLIPARLASTRLPRKALADIGGVPMIVRVARRAAASKAARVVVAADDAEIVAACAAHDVAAVLTSPRHATGSDRIAEASEALGLGDGEIVVNVQGDEPLIEPTLLPTSPPTAKLEPMTAPLADEFTIEPPVSFRPTRPPR